MQTSFKLEDLYNQVEPILKQDLSSACMPAMSIEDLILIAPIEQQSHLREAISKALFETKLSYSSQFGSEQVRSKITQLYSHAPSPSSMLLTSGASEAIFLVMSTMFEAGDTIIVQQPIYQSLYQIAQDRGVKVIDWDSSSLCYDTNKPKQQGWCLSELEELIKANPQSKALVINNPNNPTGLAFKEDELKEISKLLEDRYLICDEVFLFISQSQIPSAINFHPNTIVISDLSKSFNMPGLRLGWIIERRPSSLRSGAIQNPLINKFSSLKNYLSLRTNSLAEALAPYVLELAPELCARNRALIKNNINILYSQESEIFDLSQITKESIEGLCIFPRIKDEALIDQLWDQERVFVAKGGSFGERWTDHARIGLTNA
ncbi:MAG: pyridoxal phosphate-dependent aminotransferase [Cyanobacteria bacterium]|nr:pyridoxal phosphate-dependent aminotransferase [Cyanobacteriota bacterium]MDA1021502.1 pyridoxal phosphate-dependent aminotransferase [Cyanobacteriota bacterium]